jgi:hypothetical protein
MMIDTTIRKVPTWVAATAMVLVALRPGFADDGDGAGAAALAEAPQMPAASQHALEAVVTGVAGLVQVRLAEDQPWQAVQVGMKLGAGAEFRTGPRSAVQFAIPPAQTVTLDRLGTVKLLQAIESGGTVTTDLGMQYGRTRYDIHAAGVEHAATIRSPSATLAVRGTRVGIQDGPLGYRAWSTENAATVRDHLQRETFTFDAGTAVSDRTDGPTAEELASRLVDAGDSWSRSADEVQLVIDRPIEPFSQEGLALDEFRGEDLGENLDQVIGPIPSDQVAGLGFFLGWNNTDGSLVNTNQLIFDLDLYVVPANDPAVALCQVDTRQSAIESFEKVTCVPSLPGAEFILTDSGVGPGPFVTTTGAGDGFRAEAIVFSGDYPLGDYRVGVHLKSVTDDQGLPVSPGVGEVTYAIQVVKKLPDGKLLPMGSDIVDFVNGSLPVASHTVNVSADVEPKSPSEGNPFERLPPVGPGPNGELPPFFFESSSTVQTGDTSGGQTVP